MNYHSCRVSRKLLTSGFISVRIRSSFNWLHPNTQLYTQIKKNFFQEVKDNIIDISILFLTLSQPSLCDIDPLSLRDLLQDAETTELGSVKFMFLEDTQPVLELTHCHCSQKGCWEGTHTPRVHKWEENF